MCLIIYIKSGNVIIFKIGLIFSMKKFWFLLCLAIIPVFAYEVYTPENYDYKKSGDKLLFVVDYSNSMGEYLEHKTKANLVRELMTRILPEISPDTKIGMRVYGHTCNLLAYNACRSSELIVPLGFANSNSILSGMSRLLNLKLKEFGLELREMTGSKKELPTMLEQRKVEMLAFVYRFLVLNLGEPPMEFTWTMYDAEGKPVSTKTYTPKSFYDEYVGVDLKNNYVMLMNDPTREFYKVYEIEYDRHQYDGKNWLYINLPIEEIEAMAIASIKDGTMMYFSCDVGKFLDRQNGVLDVNYYDYGSLMGTTFGMDKRERILTGSSGSSHAMTLMAVDLDENGNARKWKVENSWGMTGHKGHLVMTDEWFEEYMFRLVVEKKYVPENILKLLDTAPIMLPPWDPMFAEEL